MDDLLVVGDLLRQAVGDQLAVVQHVDAVGDVHDHVHVVLDQQHRVADLLQVADEAQQLHALRRVHAGGGLVQQQELCIRGHRAGDLHLALLAVGQALGVAVDVLAQADGVQNLDGLDGLVALLPAEGGGAEQALEEVVLRVDVGAHQNVLDDAHLGEEAQVLEGAGDAAGDDLLRRFAVDALIQEGDCTVGDLIDAGEHVEHGGLARAVGADQRDDLALIHMEADVVHGAQAAELDRDVFNIQKAHACAPFSPEVATPADSMSVGLMPRCVSASRVRFVSL